MADEGLVLEIGYKIGFGRNIDGSFEDKEIGMRFGSDFDFDFYFYYIDRDWLYNIKQEKNNEEGLGV